jgi:hypothetical protein
MVCTSIHEGGEAFDKSAPPETARPGPAKNMRIASSLWNERMTGTPGSFLPER